MNDLNDAKIQWCDECAIPAIQKMVDVLVPYVQELIDAIAPLFGEAVKKYDRNLRSGDKFISKQARFIPCEISPERTRP